MGSSQRDNDSSPNLSVNDLKQKEIEIKEGSARVLWYETQLLIGQPNGGSPKFQGGCPKLFFFSNLFISLLAPKASEASKGAFYLFPGFKWLLLCVPGSGYCD